MTGVRGSGMIGSRVVTGLVLVVAAFGVTVAPASATKYVDSFVGNPTNATGSTGGLFNSPRGVAVDNASGDLFAVDAGNHRIQRFSSSGTFLRAWGRDVVNTGPGNADEQQRVTVVATGGTFTLTFTQTTAPIAWDASAATVQAALEALPAIGAGNVAVSGGAGGPWLVTFVGTLADANRAQMTASGAGLTGTTPSVTVLTVADGGNTFEVCVPANGDVCKAGVANAAGGSLSLGTSATSTTNPFRGGIAVNQTTGDVYVTDGVNLRVQQFTAAGQFVRAFGQDVVTTGRANNVGTTGLEVCDTTTNPANDLIDCKVGTTGSVGGAFATLFDGYPAIAPAGAPNAGNVVVADPGNRRVQEFTSSGQFVRAFGMDVIPTGGTGNVPGALNNERQTVRAEVFDTGTFLTGPPTGGTFTLTFNGQTTSAIPFDASSAVIDAALESLSSVGAGNVQVTSPGTSSWVVEFVAGLGQADQPAITGDGAALQGGVGSVVVATAQPGGPGPEFEVCTVAAECRAGVAGPGPGLPAGRFGNEQPKRVAVDATGAIYASEPTFAGGNFRAQKFTPQPGVPALAPTVFAADLLSSNGEGASPVDIAVDPVTNRVFVSKGFGDSDGSFCPTFGISSVPFERRVLELSSTGVLLDTHMECAGFSTTQIFGLAFRPASGRLYLSSTYPGAPGTTHRVYALDDDGITPALASVNPATTVTDTTAQLTGTVNPNSVDNTFTPTAWKIQYSRNGADWQTAAQGSLPAGVAPVNVSGTATGLLPNTTYRIRVITQKPFANPEIASAELTMLTDSVNPGVTAVRADSITETGARLTGQVNPHSTLTRYRFEYGVGGLAKAVPLPDGTVGAGPDFEFVSEQLSGLAPGTTYQFRLVATSETEGATASAIKTFTTAASPPGELAREFELVSPADKVGGTGVGRWPLGPGGLAPSGFAAWTGDRFAAMGLFGSVLRDDGGFSFSNDWAFADRVSDSAGWQSHSPISHGSRRAQHVSFLQVAASSEDLSSLFWGSNSTPFFFEGFEDPLWQQYGQQFDSGYLSDWGGPPAAPTRWELFGPEDLSSGVNLPAAVSIAKLWEVKLSADGSTAVGHVGMSPNAPRLALVRGLAGPGDPTAPGFGDLVSGRSIYVADLTGGLTDTFATGERRLLNVCTGAAGADRTMLPAVDGAGDVGALECPAPAAGRDARLVSDHGASLKAAGDPPGNETLAGRVSEDGSRVFFLAPDPAATGVPNGTGAFCSGTGAGTLCPPQLFVRQRTPGGEEVVRWISRAEEGLFGTQDSSLTGSVRFEGATPDGDKVFFRTNSPLTADDPNGACGAPCTAGPLSSNSWDLYMYDLPDDLSADPADGELTRISAGPAGDGDCNSPLPAFTAGSDNGQIGALRAVSSDGRRVYFTCTAPLPGVGAPADGARLTTPGGTTSTSDATNLYLYDGQLPSAQRWRFIARLPRSVASDGLDACASAGTIPKSPFALDNDDVSLATSRTANCVSATSDGAFVTFMTGGRLTVDDALSPATGDIYGYDADSDELLRITAAQGGSGEPQPCTTLSATPLCWGTGAQDSTPEISGDGGRANNPLGLATDPLIAGDRVAFFQSLSRLVPEDVDDAVDVYQWRNGDLSLVSDGATSPDGAVYKGNDRSGRNVYLATRDKLSWQDVDDVGDVYAARVGGGIAQPPAPPICGVLAGACQDAGPVATPVPPRATKESGDGNAEPGVRGTVKLARVTAKDRASLAAGRKVKLIASVNRPGELTVEGRARIGKLRRNVVDGAAVATGPGRVAVTIDLSGAARRALSKTGRLRVALEVSFSQAALPATASIELRKPRAKSKKPTGKGR